MAVDWSGTAPGVASSVASITQAIAAIQNMKFQRLLQLAAEQREDRLRQEDRNYSAGLLADEREYSEELYGKRRKDMLSDYEREKQDSETDLLVQTGEYSGEDHEKRQLSDFYRDRLSRSDRLTDEQAAMHRSEFGLRQKESEARLEQIKSELEIQKLQWEDYKDNRQKQKEIERRINELVTEYDATMASLNKQPSYEDVPMVYKALAGGTSNSPVFSAPLEKWLSGTKVGNFLYGTPLGGNARDGFTMDVPDREGQAMEYWKKMEPDNYLKAQQRANEMAAYEETARLRRALMAIGAYDRNQYLEDPMGTAINFNPSILPKLPPQTWIRR